MRRIGMAIVLAALAFGLLVLAGCASGGASSTSGASSSSASTGTGSSGSSGDKVNIASFSFAPTDLLVKPGTKVTWTNNDSVPHTVTADDGSFDSGQLSPGASWSHVFSAAGVVAYHCSIHPSMTAKVTVQ